MEQSYESVEPGNRCVPSRNRGMIVCTSGTQPWLYHVPLSLGQKYNVPLTLTTKSTKYFK